MHILIGTDADYVVNEVQAALGGPDVSFTVCRNGRAVTKAVETRHPDLAVLDLQIGSMGAMAVTMGLRLDESSGLLPHVNVLMLLDRRADVHLAKRCGAEEWLIKPIDALTIKRAAHRVMGLTSTMRTLSAAPQARRWKHLGSTSGTAVAEAPDDVAGQTPEEESETAG